MTSKNALTILLVDDEAEIRSGLRNNVPWNEYGFHLTGTACNGAEALEMIRWYEPDIVITDIQMPVMNGLDMIRRAKEEGHECSFIVLSGFDDFQYAQQAIRYNVHEYLLKPIFLPELSEILNRLKSEIQTRKFSRREELSTLKNLREATISIRKNQLVPELLRSEITADELTCILSDYAIPLRNDTCIVSLIQMFHPRQEEDGDEEERIHDMATLKKELEKCLPENLGIVTQTTDSLLFLLLNLPSGETAISNLRVFLETYIRNMEHQTGVHLFASIGKPAEDLLHIAPSYQSALQALSFHIYKELGPVIDSNVLDFPFPPSAVPKSDVLDTILQCDAEALSTALSNYLMKLHYIPTPPPSYLYSMCNYLIISLKNSLSQHLGKSPTSYTGDSYMALQNLETLEDIHDWMYDILTGFLHELQISRATRNDPLIEKAISYIQDNILGKIHMDDICNHVGLSKSYFSTYFKQKTQLNFRDYILDLKISYAQEQLKLPEHNPGELAILLGYEDYRSFSRAFKLRTGFTPSDYQKKYLHTGDTV